MRARGRRRRREVGAPPRRPCPSRGRASPPSVSTTTKRHGREWCGAGAMHAASTSASSVARRRRERRIDRRASEPERTRIRRAASPRGTSGHDGCGSVIGRGRPAAARISSRTEPSRNHVGVEAAHDRDRDRRRLAHHQLGRARDLVGDRDLGDVQLAAARVGLAAQVDDRGDARDADRDVGEPVAPRRARTCRRSRPRPRRRPRRGSRCGSGAPSGRCRPAAARRTRPRRSRGRCPRSRTRSRGGSR